MLFNTLPFAIFLVTVFCIYWSINRHLKVQNIFLLLVSWFFYACWDWRFLFLLLFSTSLDYYSGLMIQSTTDQRKRSLWFWCSILINLGFLVTFKYFNFFADSFATLLSSIGFQVNMFSLSIILPVGISFYTFHGLSYVIDIYNRRINAEKNFVNYAVFVSFFPLLVAGPIERAQHLLPQITKPRTFNYSNAVDGLKQILWGLFKKVVIADQCAIYADMIFDHYTTYSGSTLLIGGFFFAFQIYGDFSGYSDIALGSARLMGIDLLKNFSYPYFSRDIAEFWRRWHISLSSWFKDYLYIPLGGSKVTPLKKIRNVLIIFLVSGFWHGANWTFIVWGLLNALYIMPLVLINSNRKNIDVASKGRALPTVRDAISIAITFFLTIIAWIFFRSKHVTEAFDYIKRMLTSRFFSRPEITPRYTLLIIFAFIIIEWLGRENHYAISTLGQKSGRYVRWSFYYVLALAVLYFSGSEKQFIYFQF